MKKLTLLLFIFLSQFAIAQLEAIGSKEYGRIIFLNYDPVVQNRIYAATSGNHIVVSNDNGVNWEVLYTIPSAYFKHIYMLKVRSSTEISFSVADGYTNCNTIYILNTASAQITKEYNVPISPDSDSGTISSFDFYDDNTLIAVNYYDVGGSPHLKTYYSNDAGVSWNMIYYNVSYEGIWPNRVYIAPNNPEKLYIARAGGYDPVHTGGIFISEDAGQTWVEKLPNIDFGIILFHPNNPDDLLMATWYASGTQNLYRSLDGSDNWNVVDANWATDVLSNGVLDMKHDPTDSNSIIVTATNSIVRTNDYFQTKQVFNFENQMENPDNYYFGFTASFNPFNTDEIIMTNNDYPLRSVDGGQTVTKIKNPYFFSQNGQLNLFENGTQKHLYYSVQNGFSHRNMNTQIETPHSILPVQFLPFTLNRFYSDEYHQGRVYGYFESSTFSGSGLGISNNHGESVFGIQSPNVYMHAITSRPGNADILLCSLSDDYVNSVLVKFDISDVDNIQQTVIPLPADGLLRDFHFDNSTPSLLWIALGKYIYKTLDFGATWILQSNGLESLTDNDKIYQISQNPLAANQLTIATTRGIFTSINSGSNWSQIFDQEVQSVKHSDTNNNHIVAVTYDTEFTMYALRYSNDSGMSWNQVPPSELLYINSDNSNTAIDFIGNNAEVYIGTFDLGVLKYTIDLNTLSNVSFKSNKNYQVYPNPSGGMVFIKSPQGLNNFSLTLYDSLGKKINEAESTDRIDLKDCNAGMYFLKVQADNGAVETHKIIKR